MLAMATKKLLVVLYGSGGLSDVGRHAVQAALEIPGVECRVLTQKPELLQETNWNCGCPEPHQFTEEEKQRFNVIPIKSWKDHDDIAPHFKDADGVVSCLGNRQPFIGDWIAHEGNTAVIQAMTKQSINRVVAISSIGIEEDWPPMEFFFGGKILAFLFRTVGRTAFKDLTLMEQAYKASDKDYLLVRPCGLGEDVVPVGKWFLQKEKYKDVLGADMAKLDCARFMVQEALKPTLHRHACVVGSEPPSSST